MDKPGYIAQQAMELEKEREKKNKREATMRKMYMLLGFAAAMGAMVPDGGYLQDGGYMGTEEDFDDELADMV